MPRISMALATLAIANAVRSRWNRSISKSWKTVSYDELQTKCHEAVAMVRCADLKKGDILCLMWLPPDTADQIALHLALSRLGITVIKAQGETTLQWLANLELLKPNVILVSFWSAVALRLLWLFGFLKSAQRYIKPSALRSPAANAIQRVALPELLDSDKLQIYLAAREGTVEIVELTVENSMAQLDAYETLLCNLAGDCWTALDCTVNQCILDIACGSTAIYYPATAVSIMKNPLHPLIRVLNEEEVSVMQLPTTTWSYIIEKLKPSKTLSLPATLQTAIVVGTELHSSTRRAIAAGLPAGCKACALLSATEIVPVWQSGAVAILNDDDAFTPELVKGTAAGRGVCFGEALDGITAAVISVGSTLPGAKDVKEAQVDEQGFLCLSGPALAAPRSGNTTQLATRVSLNGMQFHVTQMLSHKDEKGWLWLEGLAQDAVMMGTQRLPCLAIEGAAQSLASVKSATLVDLGPKGPALIIKVAEDVKWDDTKDSELREVLGKSRHKKCAKDMKVMQYPPKETIPLDKQNIKVDRSALTKWAQKQQ